MKKFSKKGVQIGLICPELDFCLGGFPAGGLRAMAAYYNYTDFFRTEEGQLITGLQLQHLLQSEDAKKMLDRILYVLNNAKFDYLDLHLYDDYENWHSWIMMMQMLCPGKPIISTETGGPNVLWEKYTPWSQAEYLKLMLITLDSLDIEESYYFDLVEETASSEIHRKSNFYNILLMRKPTYYVIQSFINGKIGYNPNNSIIFAAIETLIIIPLIYLIKKIKKKMQIGNINKNNVSMISN